MIVQGTEAWVDAKCVADAAIVGGGPKSRRTNRSQRNVPAMDIQTKNIVVWRNSSFGNVERCSMWLMSGLTCSVDTQYTACQSSAT